MNKKRRLRVLTLNLHKGFSTFNRSFVLHELRDAIRKTGSDIVFLQEVLGEQKTHARNIKSWPAQTQYEFLADSVWKDFAYGKNAVYPMGHHGNALLSKYPIEVIQQQDVSSHQLESRGILHCEIHLAKNLPFHCICLHLGLFARHRRQQMKKISEFIKAETPSTAPLIVAGDFNDWTQRAEEQFASPLKLKEAFLTKYGKHPKTFPAALPMLSLDRIYTRGFKVLKTQVLNEDPWTRLSDHLGLLAELELAV